MAHGTLLAAALRRLAGERGGAMTIQLECPPPAVPSSIKHNRQLRVALLTNENTPYRVPLYRELASTTGWDFHVFTCIDREFDRLWEVSEPAGFKTKKSYSLKYMRHQDFGHQQVCHVKKEVHLPIGIVTDLLKFRPDVVLSNEFGMRTLLAAFTAKLIGHKLVVYNEATCHTEKYIGRPQKLLRKALRARPDAYICNGKQSREYLETLGAKKHDVFEVGQALDLESFDNEQAAGYRDELRKKWNIHGTCFLYVGQLIKFKGTDNLIEAWIKFCQSHQADTTLVIAGEGEDRQRLESELAKSAINNVRFLGFTPRSELANVYAAADVFVFPTLRDCFSLAFEEGMAAGLPVIGSIYGGESELVQEGVNGWVCDPLDSDDLVNKLKVAWNSRHNFEEMGERARRDVQKMGIAPVAERIRAVIDRVMHKGAK
jgi:glycosyltransferase involved in cell wall biosynthesis